MSGAPARHTARIDRGEKLDAYRRMPTLRSYLVVDHRWRRVERHWRESADGEWRREEVSGAAEMSIPIPCLDTSLTIDTIYRRIELPAAHGRALGGYTEIEADEEEWG